MYSSGPTQPYHFQADLNWCDGTFKGEKVSNFWDFTVYCLPKEIQYIGYLTMHEEKDAVRSIHLPAETESVHGSPILAKTDAIQGVPARCTYKVYLQSVTTRCT